MRTYVRLGLFLAAGAVVLAASGQATALPGATTRVSVDSAGAEADGPSASADISADGRYVAFLSDASNLVAGDTNSTWDVFVHDRQAGATTRASVDSTGAQGNDWSTYSEPAISADGRYVAFESKASNLVPDDTVDCGYGPPGNCPDIFVHDRQTGATTRVSVDSTGAEADMNSAAPDISADGRYVAFSSWASNLVANDTNWSPDIFVHDRQTGATTRVSVDSAGNEAQPGMNSQDPAMSADGRYVAFTSGASNLVAGDNNGLPDIFVHDRQTGATTRVSVDSTGAEADDDSGYAAISADGRYVAFHSWATNLAPDEPYGVVDVFVHDRQTGATARVSVDRGAGIWSWIPSISADGRYVAFGSGYGAVWKVFVHDRQTGVTGCASLDIGGYERMGQRPAVSGDGRYVAFESDDILVPEDTSGVVDVFVHDLAGAVGGIAELPQVGDSSATNRTTLAVAAVATALLALTAGAWYARRRWLR